MTAPLVETATVVETVPVVATESVIDGVKQITEAEVAKVI
jgi:hypothetical protein